MTRIHDVISEPAWDRLVNACDIWRCRDGTYWYSPRSVEAKWATRTMLHISIRAMRAESLSDAVIQTRLRIVRGNMGKRIYLRLKPGGDVMLLQTSLPAGAVPLNW